MRIVCVRVRFLSSLLSYFPFFLYPDVTSQPILYNIFNNVIMMVVLSFLFTWNNCISCSVFSCTKQKHGCVFFFVWPEANGFLSEKEFDCKYSTKIFILATCYLGYNHHCYYWPSFILFTIQAVLTVLLILFMRKFI